MVAYRGIILVEGQIEFDSIACYERVPRGAPGAEKNLKTLDAGRREVDRLHAIRISDPVIAVQAHLVDDVHASGAPRLGCRATSTEAESTDIRTSDNNRIDGVA